MSKHLLLVACLLFAGCPIEPPSGGPPLPPSTCGGQSYEKALGPPSDTVPTAAECPVGQTRDADALAACEADFLQAKHAAHDVRKNAILAAGATYQANYDPDDPTAGDATFCAAVSAAMDAYEMALVQALQAFAACIPPCEDEDVAP